MTERATEIAAPATADRPKPRLSYLDGVRAVAALYVVLHHIWFTVYPSYPVNTGPAALGWLVYGHLAVAVFIVVSGFSLTVAPARREFELGGTLRFLRRRAWRILPPYWAALALSVIVFGLITPELTGRAITLKGVIAHFFLVQDVIDSPKPNGAFWSIAVEWQIYFLFPLVLLFRRKLGPVWMVAIFTTAVIGAQLVGENVGALDGILNLTPQFLALFVFGVAAAQVVRDGRSPRGLATLGIGCFAAFGVLAAVKGSVWVDHAYFWIDLLVGVGTACILAALAGGGLGPLRSLLAGRVLSGIGLYSYSVYLVHLPILWLIGHFAVEPVVADPLTRFVLLLAVGMAAVLAGSYLFHRAFERPFLENRSLSAVTAAIRGRRERL
ncbi:Peptidoglycan/LPS O-acetylase OafA/YrhL, contains acyltransferase and SGNH-hydrolase domains [Actinokineospora alba]|uniref:Peptidoglycan/LPS O-acetylase OafA/YrhL, contains acyltransferase and SGNH-hydrolase domains n=1 Tax=Actinokineospora alba TaxID=504798 RepID=A0A1H0PHE1_9PSEU|nr:acyltransferase [Actinokineospora alba]TDP65786.1 peptidoglycan/LPS O-acetylase OafA/YrhL [Actinokineospora alba]SDI65172.1 Peptidoglycan/LPS O-acetylase OafA/YrhL, contains acyltransferase and SGNH-hydrolase domains [Actinokineospora alba]SDP04065.1 Peptidoglycan/LPS O-acetylase OafA/YrhL, contains acyltransferase and SGNH-hydrolase domains [Actinokineospora alba]